MGIKITGTLDPGGGDYGILEDIFLIGSSRAVKTISDRNNIPVLRRKWGMIVYVQETDIFYYLKNKNGDISDNKNWTPVVASIQSTVNYTTTFTQNDLNNGILEIEHNLNLKNNIGNITIRDNNSKLFNPDDITFTDKNTLQVDLRSVEPIEGEWAIIITGIQDTENQDSKNQTSKPVLNNSGAVLNNTILG